MDIQVTHLVSVLNRLAVEDSLIESILRELLSPRGNRTLGTAEVTRPLVAHDQAPAAASFIEESAPAPRAETALQPRVSARPTPPPAVFVAPAAAQAPSLNKPVTITLPSGQRTNISLSKVYFDQLAQKLGGASAVVRHIQSLVTLDIPDSRRTAWIRERLHAEFGPPQG